MQNVLTLPQKRIFIIDDDADLLEILRDFFTGEGFDVATFSTADNIFSDIECARPGVILIDYLLNGINGGEICHQIKSRAQTAKIPVVLFSAFSKVFLSLGNYGCDLFIPKPFDLDFLLAQLSALITVETAAAQLCSQVSLSGSSINY